jgi:LCP family protein required for cell wall assembly
MTDCAFPTARGGFVAAEVDEGWGPHTRGRGRRRIRPLRWLVIVLVLLLLLVAAVLLWVSSRIPTIEVDGLASTSRPMHVLVVGSDSREELTAEQRRALSTGSAEGERTDTIFLMTIQGGRTALLAFPRDLWVTRCDGSTGRINVAEEIGGPSCLVQTVRELSGIDVQHYVRVTFGGFVDVVDAVGGVEVCLEEPINDRDAGIDLPAGCQVLEGPDALGYVRVRKIDDDLGRIQRQQRFLQALARQVAAPSTLLNPVRSVRTMNEVGGALATDSGMGPFPLLRLAWGGRSLATGGAVAHTVPGTPDRTSGGADILRVREAEAEALFATFRDGSILSEGPPEVAPEEVRVRVLNGAGVPGLAGRIGDLLSGRGYDVVEVGNTDTRDRTTVRYPPGGRPGAQLVARDVPGGAELEETNEVTVVTLLLGRDAGGR